MRRFVVLASLLSLRACATFDPLAGARLANDTAQAQQNRPAYQGTQGTQTDFACLNRCTATGSTYAFCQSRCSY